MKIPVKTFIYNIKGRKVVEWIEGYFTISKIDNQEVYLNFINQGYIEKPY